MAKSKTKSPLKSKLQNGNWIEKLVNGTFSDECQYNKNGEIIRGPGFFCGLWIILMIVSTIFNIVWSWSLAKDIKMPWSQILIQKIIDIVITWGLIIFVYNMCYRCRGWYAFFLVIIIMSVINLIRFHFFSSYKLAMIEVRKQNQNTWGPQ